MKASDIGILQPQIEDNTHLPVGGHKVWSLSQVFTRWNNNTHTCKSWCSDPHKQQRRRSDAHLWPVGYTSQHECADGRWWFQKLQYKRQGLINHISFVTRSLPKLQSKQGWKPVFSFSNTDRWMWQRKPSLSFQQSSNSKDLWDNKNHSSELVLAAGGRCGRNKIASMQISHVILVGNEGTAFSPQTYPRSGGLCSQEWPGLGLVAGRPEVERMSSYSLRG